MGIADEIMAPDGWHAALAALAWQYDLGAVEAIGESGVDAFALPAEAPRPARAQPPASGPAAAAAAAATGPASAGADRAAPVDAVAAARGAAAAAATLPELRAALAAYPHCELRQGARNLVFADGLPGARVLVLGEAPGRDEDLEGRPFVGRAGQLLDRMFAAIGLARSAPDRERALYITNVMPWRPPQNRDPSPEEIAMMQPFVARHIALADPELVVVMGNVPLQALLGLKGITRARGQWAEALGRPVLPMFHPAFLLRQPLMKREAWADLLALRARLEGRG
jgi:DNA polymerase